VEGLAEVFANSAGISEAHGDMMNEKSVSISSYQMVELVCRIECLKIPAQIQGVECPL
jgi:hypothetical protein